MPWPSKDAALAEARRRLGEEWHRRAEAAVEAIRAQLAGGDPAAAEHAAALRAELVRILYQVRWEGQPVPGPTAWAYFDVGAGWAAEGAFGGDFPALVKAWAGELQRAGAKRKRG